jgi:adenine/guanine phosphoribosyltransferase-like PRPP-binding protein
MSTTESDTEPTTGYWQELFADIPARFLGAPPYRLGYPVMLPCGRILVLPLRQLPESNRAVASLIANQASSVVVATLADHMAAQVHGLDAEILIGLPTLGLAFASLVSDRLGHSRYVPLGYSRKFWYDDALSEPVTSITSPEAGKRLRLDPNLLSLIKGRRVVLVDDAISTGATAIAAVRLLQKTGAEVAGMVVAMKQSNRWEALMASLPVPPVIRAVYGCPLFQRGEGGWLPIADTQPSIP